MRLSGNEALEHIENQLYSINALNVSLRWIGMKQTPTFDQICEHNKMLGIIIKEIRELRETGELDLERIAREFEDD